MRESESGNRFFLLFVSKSTCSAPARHALTLGLLCCAVLCCAVLCCAVLVGFCPAIYSNRRKLPSSFSLPRWPATPTKKGALYLLLDLTACASQCEGGARVHAWHVVACDGSIGARMFLCCFKENNAIGRRRRRGHKRERERERRRFGKKRVRREQEEDALCASCAEFFSLTAAGCKNTGCTCAQSSAFQRMRAIRCVVAASLRTPTPASCDAEAALTPSNLLPCATPTSSRSSPHCTADLYRTAM